MGARDPSPCLRVMASQKRNVRRVDTRVGQESVTSFVTVRPLQDLTIRHIAVCTTRSGSIHRRRSLPRDLSRSWVVYRRPRRARLMSRESRGSLADDRFDAVTNTHTAQPCRRHHFAGSSNNTNACRPGRRFPKMHRTGLGPIRHPSIRPTDYAADLRRAAHRDRRRHRPHTHFDFTRRRHRLCSLGERRTGIFRRVRHTRCRHRRLVLATPREQGDCNSTAQVCQSDAGTPPRDLPDAQATA
ncbi:hypothetical protein PCO31110_01375 [Pandoraea communis]|uniref:Uncharacterized protein n=1 Tax=Pandoraea communis TaxID=2508297 RepID=A0A5E4TJB8_9BURK|nr:hypothetical protein PCO31110_01375 [Pandoraea communis]